MSYDKTLKAFLGAFNASRTHQVNFKKFESDRRILSYEKKLLHALESIRKGQNKNILEMGLEVGGTNPLINGFAHYILGVAQFNLVNYKQAEASLLSSLEEFQAAEDRNYIFYPFCFLILTYSEMMDKDRMAWAVKETKKFINRDDERMAFFLHKEAIYFLRSGQESKAIKSIDLAFEKYSKHIIGMETNFLMIRLLSWVSLGDLKNAENDLNRYSMAGGHKINGYYKYCKVLLEHVMYDRPIYFYKSDFPETEFEYLRLQFLQNLSTGSLADAKSDWAKLATLSPRFAENFSYLGPKDLFRLVFDKYKQNLLPDKIDLELLNAFDSHMDKLHFLLTSSKKPLSREELIFYIWGEKEYDDKSLKKLSMLLARVKLKYGIDTSNSKGAVSIKKSA